MSDHEIILDSMSIELPEAQILARQLDDALRGKRVKSATLRDYARLQRIGFLNRDLKDYERLVSGGIVGVISSGNSILVKLDNGMNLYIAPEYGGTILYHAGGADASKFHLRLDFTDQSALTVRLTSMGLIRAASDDELNRIYVYRRDFHGAISPVSVGFDVDRFKGLLAAENRALKPVLVGKDAVVVGLSNSAFQDILYRAGLHPNRKASELSADEARALYDAINLVIGERLRLGGKDQFIDLHGKKGGYAPAMGPHMKDTNCPRCGTPIEKIGVGGRYIYHCPRCQKR